MFQQQNQTGFIYFLNFIKGKTPSEIEIIFSTLRFIDSDQKFMNFLDYVNTQPSSSNDKLVLLQSLFAICPSNVLSLFLSKCNVSRRLLLLECDTDIWIKYLIELIKEGNLDEIFEMLRELQLQPHKEFGDYHLDLILSLEIQIWNHKLEEEVRYDIFELIFSSHLIMIVVQNDLQIDREPTIREANNWIRSVSSEFEFPITFLWHSEIDDVISFVQFTFPLAQNCVYYCGICQCDPNELDEDGSVKVFRSMTCCPQMCCHDCLVRQATACNTSDHESKDTTVFVCPYCREEISFFPPNL